jgi:TRAP-type mannitol/chloroaromatic compound transport system substrate-binding protein
MPSKHTISPGTALIAVVTALVAGILISLALRPPGMVVDRPSSGQERAARQELRWKLTSAFGTNLPVIGEGVLRIAADLKAASGGAIDLEVFEPGEIVPPLEITESVKERKTQAGFTWVGYDQGRIPASTLIAAVPFGMEPWEFTAWWYFGGGRELGEALYHEHDVQPLLCSMHGPETAGWFRKPITSLDDFAGMKIRFAGLGGKVLQRVGASVTMIPAGEIFQALEKGAIDATEFSIPVIDQMLGFDRVAKFNYFPGWHQPFAAGHLLINLDAWNEVNDQVRDLMRITCRASVTSTLAQSEALQGEVIRNFSDKGVTTNTLPLDVLETLRAEAQVVLDEEADGDAHFARILRSQREFSETYGYWKRKGYLPRDF